MLIGDRIGEVMKDNGLNYRSLGLSMGYSDSQVRKIVLNKSMPGYDFLNSILKLNPALSTDWLMTGRGGKLKSDHEPTTLKEPQASYGTINSPIYNQIIELEHERGDEFKQAAKRIEYQKAKQADLLELGLNCA